MWTSSLARELLMSAKAPFPLFSALFLLSHTMHLISPSFGQYSEDLCSHVLCLPLQVHYHHWRYWFVTGNLKLDTVSILDITSFFTRSIYHRLHIHKP
ncbi:hypothetical protein HanRHA438_Chr07g0303831 [Helianthus annuus]|nr:hypothetical protein HanIR_Chr07g0316501 [Helianthus annuus]KAJ0907853.1 hypothetical protein HanRHA438_Chr07g0303831 [Helianthus annuus]